MTPPRLPPGRCRNRRAGRDRCPRRAGCWRASHRGARCPGDGRTPARLHKSRRMYVRLPTAAACPILGGAMPPPVFCRVLGPLRVTVAGADAPAELLWRKHVALLVYLARSPRKSRTREHLIGLLWSDRDERQARHSLSEALRVLRRALGEEGVVADVDQVRLAPDAVALDCDRFTELCQRGEWIAAAALVDGEFLEGLAIPEANDFENWLAAERALWRARALDAPFQKGAP